MTYTIDIANLLTSQLKLFLALKPHQLCGHVANLDFWLNEVQHCLSVLDGYTGRFDLLKDAQTKYLEKHPIKEHNPSPEWAGSETPPPTRFADSGLKAARHDLRETTYQFLLRCFYFGMIDESAVRRECDSLDIGIETSDFKRQL